MSVLNCSIILLAFLVACGGHTVVTIAYNDDINDPDDLFSYRLFEQLSFVSAVFFFVSMVRGDPGAGYSAIPVAFVVLLLAAGSLIPRR